MIWIAAALFAADAATCPAGASDPPLPDHPPRALPVMLPDDIDAPPPEFRQIGSFVVTSRLKITNDQVTRVPIKPFIIDAFLNGVELRLLAGGREESGSCYEIYRSDGVGRLNPQTGVLEVIPGIQGSSCSDGVLRHVRLTRETLTITQFAGVSNQTMVTHAVTRPQARAGPDDSSAGR